ncbi:MAG: Gfo/Idh/MocA family oxidoreductase [Planctomycetes bacterium]|nr:Gfo/Idh/MocA family oxidoreductase [Planctomycetota bacterium]
MPAGTDRRQFLQEAAAAMSAAVISGYTATARGYMANETLNVAAIGTGGRCRQLMKAAAKIQGVRLAAVCDIWDTNLELGKNLADEKAVAVKDFRRVLDRQDIDAVIIGAPDHQHVPLTIAACQAGKDVYVEKPLTHEPSEGQAVIDAQNHHKRIVQVGTQQRSMPQYQKGLELVKAGALGDIHKVHMTWNRNQPRHKITKLNIDPKTVDWEAFLAPVPTTRHIPFDEYKFRNWRWFWTFGGGIFTDLMVHQIDIANWLLDLGAPATAASIGDQFTTAGVWETPDTVQTLMSYPDRKVQAYFEGTFCNQHNKAMIEIMGSEGTLYMDRGRMEFHPEPKSQQKASELVIAPEPRGSDFFSQPDGELLHVGNWVECVRSRQTPRCPAEVGVTAANAAHLANRSLRSGQIARWQG